MKCFDNAAPPRPADPIPRRAWAVVLASVPLHLGLAAATDLSPDEAYYLCAARLGRPIVDHPPLLPWLLRWSDRLPLLPVELRVRIWPVLFSLATGIGCVALARRRGAGAEGAVMAAWLGSWALLPTAGGFVATPDGPLLLATLAALLLPPPAAAAAMLLGAPAKVSALPVAAAIALGRRSALLAAAPLLALPWLWPSLRFQLRHAFVQGPPAGWSALAAIGAVLAAIAAQAALWSPPVLWRGLRALAPQDRALGWGLSALVLLSAALRGVPPEPNWWAPAALVVLAAFAAGSEALTARARRAVVASVLVPTLIAAAHTAVPFLPLPVHADPTARLHGWTLGHGPDHAPGVGSYGPSAERCIYLRECDEISSYFNKMQVNEGSGQ